MLRVDIIDPSDEGAELTAALGRRGIEARQRRPKDVLDTGSDAAVIVIATDAEHAGEALASIRVASGTMVMPIIAVGTPSSLRDTDADAHYPRPFDVTAMVDRIESLLRAPVRPPSTDAVPVGALGLRESTLELAVPAGGDDENRSSVLATSEVRRVGDDDAERKPRGVPSRVESVSGERFESGQPDSGHWQSGIWEGTGASGIVDRADARTHGEVKDHNLLSDEVLSGTFVPDGSHGGTLTGETSGMLGARADHGGPRSGAMELAHLSDRLVARLKEADRRVFPERAPLELRFYAGGSSAEELVPKEFFEHLDLSVDADEFDPVEAFTYLGAPPVTVATPLPALRLLRDQESSADDSNADYARESLSSSPPGGAMDSAIAAAQGEPVLFGGPEEEELDPQAVAKTVYSLPGPGRRSAAPGDGVDSPARLNLQTATLGEPSADGVGRRGELVHDSGLRVLMTLSQLQGSATTVFALSDGSEITLTCGEGRIHGVFGDVSLHAFTAWARMGHADLQLASRINDGEAEALLRDAVAAGKLGRYEHIRLLGEAQTARLERVVIATEGTFALRPEEPSPDARRPLATLGGSMMAQVIGAAQRAVTGDIAGRILDLAPLSVDLTMPGWTIKVAPRLVELAAEAGMPPEVLARLSDVAGREQDGLPCPIATAPGSLGLLGILVAGESVGLASIALSTDTQPEFR